MGGNIPGGNFLGGDFPVGGIFQGGSLMGGNFPRTEIMYKLRNNLRKKLLKQLYFSLFIHSYLNYVNVGWVSTSKSNVLFSLSRSSRPEVFS